jgi:hypothetical protein
MYTTGKCNTMFYTIRTPTFGHDEDLDAGRLSVLLKKQNGITFTVFNNIILFLMDYWLSTGYNRFQTDEKLLEENYRTG